MQHDPSSPYVSHDHGIEQHLAAIDREYRIHYRALGNYRKHADSSEHLKLAEVLETPGNVGVKEGLLPPGPHRPKGVMPTRTIFAAFVDPAYADAGQAN